jgi:DNA-binding CsgD family transcriptional regulator
MLRGGATTAEAAARMNIAPQTVRVLKARLARKGVRQTPRT